MIVVIFLDKVNVRYQIANLRIYMIMPYNGMIVNGMINKQINHG